MKKRVVVPALLIAALAAGGLLYFTRIHPLEKVEAKPTVPTVPIVAGPVTQHDVPIYLSGVGTVIAYNTDLVRAQIQGQIISINFTEGQKVHAGDLLAQIDPRPNQAAFDQAVATKVKDEAQLANARRDFERYTKLQPQDLASKQTVDTQKALVAQLAAQIKGDDAAIDNARRASFPKPFNPPSAMPSPNRNTSTVPAPTCIAVDTAVATITPNRPGLSSTNCSSAFSDTLCCWSHHSARSLAAHIDTSESERFLLDWEHRGDPA